MPTTTYDRSHNTHDFDMVDLHTVEEVEVSIDDTGKLWINVNGKCLLRVGKPARITIEDKRYGAPDDLKTEKLIEAVRRVEDWEMDPDRSVTSLVLELFQLFKR